MTAAPSPLWIANARGQRLAARLHGAPSEGLAISCHGMLSTKDGNKHQLLATYLHELGVPLLRFDFAGRGESDGKLYDLAYSHEVEDLDAVIEYFWRQGVKRFAVFGSSMGGAVAYLTAARDERIVAVASLAAVAHPELVAERHPEAAELWQRGQAAPTDEGGIGPGFLEDALQQSVIASVSVLRGPVLVIHGEKDDIVPPSDAHDIAAAARQASLEMVPGADHRFSREVHLRPALRRIAAFLATALHREPGPTDAYPI